VGWLFGVPIIVMLPEGRGAAIPGCESYAKAMAETWKTLEASLRPRPSVPT